jgi:hypothetical protein
MDQQQPVQEQSQEQSGNAPKQFNELVSNVHAGLGMLSEILSEARPDLGGKAQELMAQFTALVESFGSEPQAQPESGMAPVEVGASGAQPMNPAQR